MNPLNLQPILDLKPDPEISLDEIARGLLSQVKVLPSKLFYDEAGSRLFDAICELPEYYLTRTEQRIMEEHATTISAEIGPNALIIELGSGSSLKTRTLLDTLDRPAGYIPVDISIKHLGVSARAIAERYPRLPVMPVCADYEQDFSIPATPQPAEKTVIYYPGSTIGNFHPDAAAAFLARMRTICGAACEMLIGADLQKDHGLLHRAYNDCDGITAAFNLNILSHLNERYRLDFNLDSFEHVAVYNPEAGRIEMYLRSRSSQAVRLNGDTVRLEQGECIWTESSYKYTLEGFGELAARAGFDVQRVWMDGNRLFSVMYLKPGDKPDTDSTEITDFH